MKKPSLMLPRALVMTIIRRMIAQPFLLFVVWIGFAIAIGLTVSIPVYAEAAGYRLLINAISENQPPGTRLPPFSLIYKYGSAKTKPITYTQWRQADRALANLRGYGIDLPTPPRVRYAATEKLDVHFADSKPTTPALVRARIGFLSDFTNHARLVAGRFPAEWDGNGPLEVLLAENTINKSIILLDDVLQATKYGGPYALDQQIVVVGVWQPKNDNDLYWYAPAASFSDVLIVPEASWQKVVNRPPAAFVDHAGWYAAYDGVGIQSSKTAALTAGITTLTSEMGQMLPGVELFKSPLEQLAKQQAEVRTLTVTLLLFGVPLIGLLLAFVWQLAGLLVARQELELAVLRSRGVSRATLLSLSLLEGTFIALAGLVVGVPLALVFARIIGVTQSFLRFGTLNVPAPVLLPESVLHGAIIAAFAIPAVLVPALGLTRNTIVTLRQGQARQRTKPWVERFFVDFLLLIPAWYGYQQLSVGKSLSVPGLDEAGSLSDPFRNPLLLLAPALCIAAGTLLMIRCFPYLVQATAWLVERFPGISMISALRQLARNPNSLRGPTLLLILTISLATFTASMARTLDQYSTDRAYYRSGADYRLLPRTITDTSADIAGEPPNLPDPDLLQNGTQLSSTAGEQATTISLDYVYVPLSEFADIDGIDAATNVAVSTADIVVNGDPNSGILYAIDPATFAQVVGKAWRPDYDTRPLGALMNDMSTNADDAIISAQFAQTANVRIGDRITVVSDSLGTRRPISLTVRGIVAYMPTLYNEGMPFVLAHYAYIVEELGGNYAYEIWLSSNTTTNTAAVQAEAYRNSLRVMPYTPNAFITAEFLQPQRQGLFGLLSVGFFATGVMSMVGMLAYVLLTLRKRSVEFGVLRAIGITQRALRTTLSLEQVITIGFASLTGLLVGIVTSQLFLPFLKVRQGTFPDTPPFLVQFAARDIGYICVTALGLMVMIILLELIIVQRMRIGEAVKLGEAV
jgi:putative ABC transport system permease protein